MDYGFVGSWHFWGGAAFASLVATAVMLCRAPWRQLLLNSERQHALFLAVLALSIFWQLEVKIIGAVSLHPLLLMSLVMIFGVEFALIAGSLALLLWGLLQGRELITLVIPWAFNVVLAGFAAHWVLLLIERLPSRNLFVYMLGGGFFGAMFTVQVATLGQWLYIALVGPAPLLVIASDYYYLSLLMMFPEGFINGAIMTMMTVFKPHLVRSFDDHRYLDE
ncbi:MAG: energy-coupling factor ABC transporter permease [Cellvibrionaceae bacterium]